MEVYLNCEVLQFPPRAQQPHHPNAQYMTHHYLADNRRSFGKIPRHNKSGKRSIGTLDDTFL